MLTLVLLAIACGPNQAIDFTKAGWLIGPTSAQPTFLAAIAISKLGERRVIHELHELIRSFIAPNSERTINGPFPPGFSSLLTETTQWHLRHRRRSSLLDYRFRRTAFYLPKLQHNHVDLGLALRRMGDETLVDELV